MRYFPSFRMDVHPITANRMRERTVQIHSLPGNLGYMHLKKMQLFLCSYQIPIVYYYRGVWTNAG